MAAAAGGIASLAGSALSSYQAKGAADNAEARTEDAFGYISQNVDLADSLDSMMSYYGDLGVENAQGLIDQWETAFGGIQQNLSDYYNNLDPMKFSQQAKTAYSESLNKQMKQMSETLTQRGLTSSGQRAQLEKEAMFNKAQTNADIDIKAPEEVARMKQGWLSQGETLRGQGVQSMSNALSNQASYSQVGSNAMMNANTGISNILTNQAAQSAESAQAWGGAAGTLMGQGVSSLADYYSKQPSSSDSNAFTSYTNYTPNTGGE